nr:cytochrome P450 81E8-like [Ipomoea batatas]
MEKLEYYYAAGLLSFLFLILLRKSVYNRKKNLPPSPIGFPVIGHFFQIKNPLHQYLASLSAKYGPILFLRFGCRSIVVVSSPSAIEECFTKNDIAFANRPPTMAGDRLTYNYTAVVWAPYGHLWRVQRRLAVVELFSTVSLHRSSVIREEEVGSLVRSLFRGSGDGKSAVDLNSLGGTLTFNAMMRLVAGKRCVEEEDVGGVKGKEIIKEIRGVIFFSEPVMSTCDFFPVLRLFGYKGIEKKMILFHKKREEFLKGLLNETRHKKTCSSDSDVLKNREEKKSSMIEVLLSLQKSEPEFYTDDLIKSYILMMFVAGSETSTVTIEWAMTQLLSNPETMRNLRSEIDSNVGAERLLNESDISKLPYLRCVVNETLRLCPPVPLLLPRYTTQDCVIGGYEVPKNTTLMVNAWAVHRDPGVWEEPEKFMPERFEAMEKEKDQGFNYKFVPFGMGRRSCPGNNMGLRTVCLALGTLVECFDWEIGGKDKTAGDVISTITLQTAKPLEAVCSPRKTAIQVLSQL